MDEEGHDARIESPSSLKAEESPEDGIFILPGGYVTGDGVVHSEVELAPVTGKEEELLATIQPAASVASVVTRLLSRCIRRIGSIERVSTSVVRDLLVGDRDYLIIKLREMTFGKKVEAVMNCPRPDCVKPMDITFSLDDIHIERKPVSTRLFSTELSSRQFFSSGEPKGNRRVEFRLPTGGDLEAMASEFHADQSRAIYKLLARCMQPAGDSNRIAEAMIAAPGDSILQEIETAMERVAPQTSIEMEMACPECRSSFDTVLDFTAFFLTEMRANLRRLEREVHFLAWHYHWSEQEILCMTRRKRQRYARLLQEEIDSLN